MYTCTGAASLSPFALYLVLNVRHSEDACSRTNNHHLPTITAELRTLLSSIVAQDMVVSCRSEPFTTGALTTGGEDGESTTLPDCVPLVNNLTFDPAIAHIESSGTTTPHATIPAEPGKVTPPTRKAYRVQTFPQIRIAEVPRLIKLEPRSLEIPTSVGFHVRE